MKKSIILISGFLLFMLSGCITIIEKYTIHRDGSGTFEYVIDMSDLHSIMEVFSDSTDQGGLNIGEVFMDVLPELSALDGISDARLTSDPDLYISGISFSFMNENSLNNAMCLILDDKNDEETVFVELGKRLFVRNHKTSDEFSPEALLSREDGLDESMVQDVLKKMKYKIEVNFDRNVRKVESKANVVVDKKTVYIEADFNAMLEDKDYLRTQIKTR